ncbi:MAG: hypothetical protein DRI44_00020 [Chlamydiae bacterium]|nr:MAG: hypothetical protein DRI44_00020 [Chlamydiota bacterium]
MKTDNKKIWKSDPWDDNIIATLSRPSKEIRNNIYEMAREQAAASRNHSQSVFQRATLFVRSRYSYALWSAAASLLIATCVWLGNTGRGTYDRYQASNDLNNIVNETVLILNEPDFSPLFEQTGVDIDEAVIVVGLQTVNEEIASLENNLQLNYLF